VVLVPAFARSVRGLPARWIYVLFCVAPAVIAVYTLYTFAPDATLKHVINYRGAPGQWGLTAFNFSLSEQMKAVWSQCVLWLFYLALGIVYVITWRKRDAASVALLALLTFYVFTPDCGTHHHAWILAVALVADFPRARVHLLLATVTLAICYVFAPFNGELFNYIRLRHTPLFWQTNLNETHLRVSGYLFLPLWIYCVWWWSVTLKSIMARREMHREAVVKEQLVRAESRAG
jgi:peptidoglycan/LPS O-acetylase OafA/YrhL